VGEPRLETAICTYTFSNTYKDLRESNKNFLEGLVSVESSDAAKQRKLLRDPITLTIPLLVKDTDTLTMNDVTGGRYLPHYNLSTAGQQLYECVAGHQFVLNDASFPEFASAIEYSIATPDLWCNKKLQEKAAEFNKDKPNIKETYLRITLGENNGESPGIPYVMEIWPVGHYSPVHSHCSANAVIRVLYGAIHVRLFPFLCCGGAGVEPFAIADLSQGDITRIRLINWKIWTLTKTRVLPYNAISMKIPMIYIMIILNTSMTAEIYSTTSPNRTWISYRKNLTRDARWRSLSCSLRSRYVA
jgi:hypothetical protein